MKMITSPLVIILVATLLGVGLSSCVVMKRVPEYAAMAAAMRPKPKVIPSHVPDRLPPVDVTSRAVSELKLAKDQLAVREAALLEQQKRMEFGRLELERTRADIDLMRKQVEVYLAEAKDLSVKARAEVTVNELKNLKMLVQTYSTMSPKSTVAIMLQMDESSAVKILALMKVDVVAGIFEEMGKQAAGDPLMAKRAAKLAEGVKNDRSAK
jgi:flagellar motility protein MotE (MotC chaperone)